MQLLQGKRFSPRSYAIYVAVNALKLVHWFGSVGVCMRKGIYEHLLARQPLKLPAFHTFQRFLINPQDITVMLKSIDAVYPKRKINKEKKCTWLKLKCSTDESYRKKWPFQNTMNKKKKYMEIINVSVGHTLLNFSVYIAYALNKLIVHVISVEFIWKTVWWKIKTTEVASVIRLYITLVHLRWWYLNTAKKATPNKAEMWCFVHVSGSFVNHFNPYIPVALLAFSGSSPRNLTSTYRGKKGKTPGGWNRAMIT